MKTPIWIEHKPKLTYNLLNSRAAGKADAIRYAKISGMTRSELISRLASRFPQLTQQDANDSVIAILEAISEKLAAGGRVEIRGFGSFSVHGRPPRVGRNPKTGEKVMVPAKYVPHFKPGVEMRERVNLPAEPERLAA